MNCMAAKTKKQRISWFSLITSGFAALAFPRAVCVVLFEIVTGLPRGVGDVGEAKHSHSGRASICVEGCRLHLDRKDAFDAQPRWLVRFPERARR